MATDSRPIEALTDDPTATIESDGVDLTTSTPGDDKQSSKLPKDMATQTYRRDMFLLMPSFGFKVPFGTSWYRTEEDARTFLEAVAKSTGKDIRNLSKAEALHTFLNVIDHALNLFPMRRPFPQRPAQFNRLLGEGHPELYVHASDSMLAHVASTKTEDAHRQDVLGAQRVSYKGENVEKLRRDYWEALRTATKVGKFVPASMLRKMVLGILESSPTTYTLATNPSIMVHLLEFSTSKESSLAREEKDAGLVAAKGETTFDMRPLSSRLRELHREFLKTGDTEIEEFAEAGEREKMEFEVMTEAELQEFLSARATEKADRAM